MSGEADAHQLQEAIRRGIAEAASSTQPERALRNAVQPVLADLLAARGMRSRARDEAPLAVPPADESSSLDAPLSATGRADAIYNRFVIEFEPPGSMRPSVLHSATRHAVEQVQQYLRGVSERDQISLDRLAGCAFDGSWIVYVAAERDQWSITPPQPVNADSLLGLVETLAVMATGRGLTAENLDEDFGRDSELAGSVVSVLADIVTARHPDSRTDALFQQWESDQSVASGPFALRDERDWRALRRSFGVSAAAGDGEVLFALQSYFALVAKLISVVVLEGVSAKRVLPGSVEGRDTIEWYQRMESGEVAAAALVTNVIEPSLFSWYAHERGRPLEECLGRIAAVANEYATEISEITPTSGRDLMKDLYQRLVPRMIRHRMGEYYTPDWLAQRVLNQTTGATYLDPSTRVLDPACGSGTFLTEVLARMVGPGPADPQALLSAVTSSVVGFDLSPLAVQAAKVNYLLALAPLLKRTEVPITIPVFLADSVAPIRRAGVLEGDSYTFHSSVGPWRIPAELVETGALPRFAALLQEARDGGLGDRAAGAAVAEALGLTRTGADQIAALAGQLRELQEAERDGLWLPLLLNAFAPAIAGRFQYVVGNPPWVSWTTLPTAYRLANADQWDFYGLRPEAPGRRQASPNVQLDLSMLFVAHCIDHYLTPTGRLGFVITASVFQSELAGRGFRRRQIPLVGAYRFRHIDDMSDLGVFENAANRTAVLIADRAGDTDWPIPVTKWRGRNGRHTIPTSVALRELRTITERRSLSAEPIDPRDASSPLLYLPQQGLDASRPLRRSSPYSERIRKGIDARGANGVFFLEVLSSRRDEVLVRNLPHEGRNAAVAERRAWVERDAVRQLVRGGDVSRGEWRSNGAVLFFHDADNISSPISPDEAAARWPRAFAFASAFEGVLRNRRRFRNFDPSGDDWLGLYSVTQACLAPYKVLVREIAQGMVAAAVLGDDVVPDHKLYVIPTQSAGEASRLATALNSPVVDLVVRGFTVSTSLPGSFLRYVGIADLSIGNGADEDLTTRSALGLTHEQYETLLSLARE